MPLKQQLLRLAGEKNTPCVTISLNTHRTHPDSEQDAVLLKNLLSEAEERVISEFGKRPVDALLTKLRNVGTEIDVNYNLDSLHIFISNDLEEVIRSSWKTSNEGVHISESFAIRSLIKSYTRSEHYLIMLLSQNQVQLFESENDTIISEIDNNDFPFHENRHYITDAEKASDPKQVDNMIREHFNKIDKALIKVTAETDLRCLVICTQDNYTKLLQVADQPSIYLGFLPVDYNRSDRHHLGKQAWEFVRAHQFQKRTEAIGEMKEAVGNGTVHTDLQEIYQAAIDGRGDLLIVHQGFSQPVLMTDSRTFDLVEDADEPGAIDDIVSNIAWEVFSKKGRVIFTSQDEIKDLGEIVLKTRY